MDSKKITIGGLIVIAVLFFLGFGLGFMQSSEEPEPDEFRPGDWPGLESMGGLLGPFGPSLDLNRLVPQSGCRSTGKHVYVLNQSSPSCNFTIKASTGDDYQKTELGLRGPGARVKVVYEPSGEDKEASEKIWSEGGDPIRLVVLEPGGRLNLECLSCSTGGRTVWVRFE